MSDIKITTFIGLTPEQQILKNAEDIKKLQENPGGITEQQMNTAINSAVSPVSAKVDKLESEHNSEYHTIETITKTIATTDWQDNKVSFTNENFKLLDSIISWYPEGTLENVKACSDAYVILQEQTVDGTITFECETAPSVDIHIIIKIELKGESY